ncbi:MAG: glycogen debranching enzyme [Deltaproteobacteria bacterium]|nr:glycogen debranching enzyme [Deltaproteobacteria bacterium]
MNRFGIHSAGNHYNISLPISKALKVELWFFGIPLSFFDNQHYKTSENLPLLKKYDLIEASKSQEIWQGQFEYPFTVLTAYLVKVLRSDSDGNYVTDWILDPFARNSLGGEFWGKIITFEVDEKFGLLKTSFECEHSLSTTSSVKLRRVALLTDLEKLKVSERFSHKPLGELVIYECHVRGMTQHHSSGVPVRQRGNFSGMQQKIKYLSKLGVDVVELLPIFDFDENENQLRNPENQQNLKNYWGYSPVLWFAPKGAYAENPLNRHHEIKEFVQECHLYKIEVWLDVVYNHSGEQDAEGPKYHFKMMDKDTWYLHTPEGELHNASGCGNTLRCGHPLVKELILESLLYWHEVMGVDGFRFDLTSIMNRHPDTGDFQDFPNLLWELRQEPRLKNVRLISEPWDAHGYDLGKSAKKAGWTEWNDRFRDTIRKVLSGEVGQGLALKDSIEGSPYLFGETSTDHWPSLNFITSHDGFTLWDLFCYSEKHNQANGENNLDGHLANFSDNLGMEGPTRNQQILGLREQKWRMAWTILAISRGPMMFVAGDEWGRTQNGNNNAYCQDNELNWLNWQESEINSDRVEFVRRLLSLRTRLCKSCWISSSSTIVWFNSEGYEADWSPHIRSFAWKIENFEEGMSWWFLCNSFDAPLFFSIKEEKSISWQWDSNHYLGMPHDLPNEKFVELGPFSLVIGNTRQL